MNNLKLLSVLILGIFTQFSYAQISSVRIINLKGLNTYRLAVLNKDNDSSQKIICTTYDYIKQLTHQRHEIL
jgi:hypothetical protein